MGVILYCIFHALCLFGVIVTSIILEDKDYIDDREIYMIAGIFVPWGVLVWLGAVYCGEKISASLT